MRHLIRLGLPLLVTASLAHAQPVAPVGDLPVPPHALPTQPLTSTDADPTLTGSAVADAGQGKAGAADNGTQPAPRHGLERNVRTTGRAAKDARPPR